MGDSWRVTGWRADGVCGEVSWELRYKTVMSAEGTVINEGWNTGQTTARLRKAFNSKQFRIHLVAGGIYRCSRGWGMINIETKKDTPDVCTGDFAKKKKTAE